MDALDKDDTRRVRDIFTSLYTHTEEHPHFYLLERPEDFTLRRRKMALLELSRSIFLKHHINQMDRWCDFICIEAKQHGYHLLIPQIIEVKEDVKKTYSLPLNVPENTKLNKADCNELEGLLIDNYDNLDVTNEDLAGRGIEYLPTLLADHKKYKFLDAVKSIFIKHRYSDLNRWYEWVCARCSHHILEEYIPEITAIKEKIEKNYSVPSDLLRDKIITHNVTTTPSKNDITISGANSNNLAEKWWSKYIIFPFLVGLLLVIIAALLGLFSN